MVVAPSSSCTQLWSFMSIPVRFCPSSGMPLLSSSINMTPSCRAVIPVVGASYASYHTTKHLDSSWLSHGCRTWRCRYLSHLTPLCSLSCASTLLAVWLTICLYRLLHYLRCLDMDYAMMPPALRPNVEVPWNLCMEELPKLWWNTTYINWKAGCPSVEVGVAMTLVSTNYQEYDS